MILQHHSIRGSKESKLISLHIHVYKYMYINTYIYIWYNWSLWEEIKGTW